MNRRTLRQTQSEKGKVSATRTYEKPVSIQPHVPRPSVCASSPIDNYHVRKMHSNLISVIRRPVLNIELDDQHNGIDINFK